MMEAGGKRIIFYHNGIMNVTKIIFETLFQRYICRCEKYTSHSSIFNNPHKTPLAGY